MLSKLDFALMPGAQPLKALDGRFVRKHDGAMLQIELDATCCSVDEAQRLVTLGFKLGMERYTVKLPRFAYWDVHRIRRWMQNAILNGNLVPNEPHWQAELPPNLAQEPTARN